MIQPDGCRDLIFVGLRDGQTTVKFTDWDSGPRYTEIQAGSKLIGYRLCPGAVLAVPPHCDIPSSSNAIEDMIASEATCNAELADIIDALTIGKATVPEIARQGGVTPRTLQRWFQAADLPKPEFWRLLGRARRALGTLSDQKPLAETAFEFGYCDQAHMSREFKRWFGHSPAKLLSHKSLTAQILQPGLGNWVSPPSDSGRLL